ncbi:glycosyltransferase family 9 protein [Candidatus Latescibacterota bacterium]
MPAIAIIQTAFIGDVVLATPLFESARVSRPDDTIVAVVRADCENLLENNPFIDELLVWDKHGRDRGLTGIIRMGKLLGTYDVTTAIIPHRSLRSALAARISGAGVRVGFAKGGGKLLHNVCVPYHRGIHEVERNFMLARAAGLKTDGFKPAIFPDDDDRKVIDDILQGMESYCVIAPGSVWPTKMWPAESYAETGAVYAGRDMGVVLSGSIGDSEVCKMISARIPGSVSVAGLLTLRQSAELYRRSEFVLTGDTAPQHIAAAAGARIFSIFGPTVRDFGFWPYTERGVVIEENVDCRPCGVHGHKRCPEGTHRCMLSINSDKVIVTIDRMIGE